MVLGIWALLAIVGGILGDDAELGLNLGPTDFLDSATTTEFKLGGGAEAPRAERLLQDRLRGPKPRTEIVIVQADTLTVDDPEFRATVEALASEIQGLGPETVTKIEHYFVLEQLLPLLTQQQLAQREETVSQDRKTTIMRLTLTGDFDQALKNVEPVLDVVHEANSEDGFSVLIVGDASISHEQNELAESDLRQGERIGLPVALIILVVLFGTIVAALMPVGLSIVCIVVAFGITALIGQAFDLIFNLTRFKGLFETSVFDEAGISYSLPDHVYAEESSKW